MHTRKGGLFAAVGCAAIAAFGVALAGCAGGGGEAAANRATSISGVFLGSQTQTRAVGDKGVVELDIKRTNGSGALSGVGRLTLNDQVFTGPISGSASGNSATIDVAYAGYGPAEYTTNLSGATMTGSFTHTPTGGGSEGGSVTLVGQLGVQTVTTTGTSIGTSTDFGVPETAFTVNFVQTGDDLAVTGTYNGISFTGTGVVIGTNITFSTVLPDTTKVVFTGVVASDRMSGTYLIMAPDPNDNNHGIWVVNRPGVSPLH